MNQPIESGSQVELRNIGLRELQQHGVEHFADINYRAAIAERVANQYDASHVVLFDDTIHAIPSDQRKQLHGVPGYERAMLPGLFMAPGFENGATVLVAAPPAPEERAYILNAKQTLENELGKPVPYRVLYQHQGEMVDLTKVDADTYKSLCNEYAETEAVRPFPETFHIDAFVNNADAFLDQGRTLVMPFQTTPLHNEKFAPLIEAGIVCMPDVPNMDKAENNFRLRAEGYQHLPAMFAVTNKGVVTDDPETYLAHKAKNIAVENTPESRVAFAEGIVSAVERLAEVGKRAYIKIDAEGVSGLGNLDPGDPRAAVLYDFSVSTEERVQALAETVAEVTETHLPQAAAVEEFVEVEESEGVRKDYGVAGMMVDGVYLPTSIFPFGTTNGVYDCGWISADPEAIGDDPDEWRNLFKAAIETESVLAQQGYRNGVASYDAFVDPKGDIKLHDYNHRRGGRSTPECVIALDNQGLFEGQVIVDDLPGRGIHPQSNGELVDLYQKVCGALAESGITPFSTSFGYFGFDTQGRKAGAEHPHDFMKFKVLVPMSHLAGVPRSEHLETVRSMIGSFAQEIHGAH